MLTVRTTVISAVLALATLAPSSQAQRGKKEPLEFTRQALLIVNFAPGSNADARMGRRAADAVRDRVDKLVNKREVEVIDGDNIRTQLERAGYSPDTTFDLSGARVIGRFLRADEFLVAHVSSTPAGPRISGHLVLLRDEHLRQPLPDATAPNLDSAAHMFARSLANARLQLVPERRCENALREGSALRAVAAAREGVNAYPASTIARTCLDLYGTSAGTRQ